MSYVTVTNHHTSVTCHTMLLQSHNIIIEYNRMSENKMILYNLTYVDLKGNVWSFRID